MTWITDRAPTQADANSSGQILISVGDSIPTISWEAWANQPWMKAPDPYELPEPTRRSWWLPSDNCHAVEWFDADPDFGLLLAEIDKPSTDQSQWIINVKQVRSTPHEPKTKK